MNIVSRFKNQLNRYYSKHLIKSKSHIFQCGEVMLKYIYIPKRGSRKLITVFSGMNPKRASYTYINQLNHIKHNRLYILDDFGDGVLGCFYLGTKEQFQVEQAVRSLLAELGEKHQYEQYIFCGSSKGGYAALNYGFEYPEATIICGAPQYRLGDYLLSRKSPQLLHVIAGPVPSGAFLNMLNSRLSEKLVAASDKFIGTVYLHYSDVEHTYDEHIRFLLQDLEKYHYHYETDRKDYPLHDQVSQYFPEYLIRSVLEATEN
jgi:hypothetical protein